jgi:hypothetical protein
VCIISAPVNNYNYPIATNLCQAPTPQCLQSARYESPDHGLTFDLATSATSSRSSRCRRTRAVDYFFLFEDEGTNWADDTDYTIFVEWLNEPDPAEAVPDPQRPATMSAAWRRPRPAT